jgi:threonine dehydrogenase-like Zn-dependent dehydrogenase
MKAVIAVKPANPAVIECADDAPMPVIDDYSALVRVKSCGICSSTDTKLAHGEHPDMPRPPGAPAFPHAPFPAILGHESTGEVVELGKKVKYYKPGDRVVNPFGGFGPPDPNGPPPKYSASYGAMVEYAAAMDYRAMKEDGIFHPMMNFFTEEIDFMTKVFPKDIDFVDAAMILTFKENYSALKNFGVKPGMDILVYGDGSISLGLSIFLKQLNVNSIVTVGHHDQRLERIRNIANPGLLINSKKDKIEDALGDKKFDLVIDAAGSLDAARQASWYLKPGGAGKVCIYGVLPKGKSALELYEVANNTSVHIQSYPYHEHRTHDEIVAFMQKGIINAKDFYDCVLPCEQAAEAFRKIETREAFKAILTF